MDVGWIILIILCVATLIILGLSRLGTVYSLGGRRDGIWPGGPNSEPSTLIDSSYRARKNRKGIFISYRRQDAPDFAGRLYDRLGARFGRENVFMDVDTVGIGLDFVDVINRSLAQCRILIVVIGRSWLSVVDDDGRPRLSDPGDYVRLEIENALQRNVRVVPVLLDGARMPRSEQLPSSMESLARRNGVTVSHVNFSSDIDSLIARLERALREP